MRLINADELKEFVKEKCSYCTSFIGEDSVLAWIDKAPTIDPDELDMLERMYAEPSDLISRKTLIEELEEWKENPNNDDSAVDLVNHFIGIIRITPSAELSGDFISRAEAIEVVGKWMQKEYGYLDLNRAERLIDALPSADRPQGEDWDKYSEKLWKLAYERGKNDRPKGEWVEVDNFINRAWECSKCGAISSIKTPFCYECGADMTNLFVPLNEVELTEEAKAKMKGGGRMSCSKWAYTPEKCDGGYCVGECDLYSKADEKPVLERGIYEELLQRFQDEETKAFAKSCGLKEHAVWNKAIRILEEYVNEC